MIVFGTVLAICCLQAAKAVPSQWASANQWASPNQWASANQWASPNQWASMPASSSSGGGQIQLEGTPDLETYSKITFPHSDLLDLGEYSEGHLPADEIKVTKESKVSYPQPYPVKVPIPQPYPVHVDKPYPVHETKIVKVPVPYPQVIEKKIPYPVEVPKPYPVPVQSHDEGNHLGGGGLEQGGGGGWGGGSFGGHQALEGNGYGVHEQQNELPSNEGWSNGVGGGNFNSYEPQALEEGYGAPSGGDSGGWQPLNGGEEGSYH